MFKESTTLDQFFICFVVKIIVIFTTKQMKNCRSLYSQLLAREPITCSFHIGYILIQ